MSSHVLFVDDEESNLVVFEAVCGDDFPVLTASSAEAALQLMAQNEIGVLLTDQRMPGMTGIELLEEVHRRWPETIRLLITAYSDLQSAEDAINRGQVRRYLRKPWEPEALKAELRDAVDLYGLNQKVKALESKLMEQERAYSLGIIAAGLADEVRAPVGWIRNNLAVAQASVDTAVRVLGEPVPNVTRARGVLAQMEAAIADAESSVLRIVELLDGMEAAPQSQEVEDVDVSEMIRVALRMIERNGLRGSALIEVASGVRAMVHAPRTRIGQIVFNVLTNALQGTALSTSGKGLVRVATAVQGPWAVLDVSDNGPTPDDEELERLFKPPGGGNQPSRMGLVIAKRITTELGGSIEATRNNETGTRLRVRLPRVEG